MSFRTKVLLSITFTVAISVWAVAWVVSATLTRSFEEKDRQRTAILIAQFRREFARRGADVGRRIDAISNSQIVNRIAAEPFDPSQYVNEAQTLAQEQSLDFLEIIAPDTSIISSAEWPARFGYKQGWVSNISAWNSQPSFLRQQELADGPALGLFAVRTVRSGEGFLYIAGGQRIDKDFLQSLPLSDGLELSLYRSFEPAPTRLEIASLISDARGRSSEITRVLSEETVTAFPLSGLENNAPLGVLLIGSSRAELKNLKSYVQRTALLVGLGGIFTGVLLSFWTASRVTRPVRELAASVREVSGGKWDARAPVSSNDEIGQLARDFNEMTQQLVDSRNRMMQAERVAAWRELARRLAHELKNPLFPLQITIENLQRSRKLPASEFDEIFEESATTLLAELDNLKNIVGRFSDFARMPAPQPEPVQINDLARDAMSLFNAQFRMTGRPQIIPNLKLESNLPEVSADPEQIQRLLRNLILNAQDAMPNGGTLTIRTETLPGRIVLEISDTGDGLTTEECERLFTPYYTTKQHGTGLGLAIVQSVVSDHGGTIGVVSEVGRGSAFRIELPRSGNHE
jgi:two-component system nitrogen regulation sensor histidine kinase NtrY